MTLHFKNNITQALITEDVFTHADNSNPNYKPNPNLDL